MIGAPAFAILGARLPRKGLLLVLMAALTVANLASAMAPTFESLVVARFASGFPHGAYFGIGAVLASSLVPRHRRARAVAMTMMGLTVANVVGVPLTTLLGQWLGWRSTYATVVVIGVLTLVAIELLVPRVLAHDGASPRQELSALRLPQVWLTLLVGAVGFGGFFAVYTYVAPTLTEVSGFAEAGVPIALALFGVGMTLGTMLGGRLADWSVRKTLVLARGDAVVQLAFTDDRARRGAGSALPDRVRLLGEPAGAHGATARRVRRRQGARRDDEPLGAQRRQRARCLARRPGDRRRIGLHRPCRGGCSAVGRRARRDRRWRA